MKRSLKRTIIANIIDSRMKSTVLHNICIRAKENILARITFLAHSITLHENSWKFDFCVIFASNALKCRLLRGHERLIADRIPNQFELKRYQMKRHFTKKIRLKLKYILIFNEEYNIILHRKTNHVIVKIIYVIMIKIYEILLQS